MKVLGVDIKDAEIGYVYSEEELNQFKMICGGVSWPGERPGFAVVTAMDKLEHFDSHIYLIDEFESFDIRELIRKCVGLDCIYRPKRWIGDVKKGGVERLIREMSKEAKLPIDTIGTRKLLSIYSTPILEINQPYQYMLTKIKELLDPDPERRQLFLKDSKILNYLSAIEPNNIYKLEFGDYPAIEALAFAVIESKSRIRDPEKLRRHRELKEKYFG